MHPFTVIIVALSATALALPRPQLGGSLTNTILNGIGDLLGTDDRYHTTERCYSRNSADLSSCISACVQAQCVEGSAECGACIRGCCKSFTFFPYPSTVWSNFADLDFSVEFGGLR